MTGDQAGDRGPRTEFDLMVDRAAAEVRDALAEASREGLAKRGYTPRYVGLVQSFKDWIKAK